MVRRAENIVSAVVAGGAYSALAEGRRTALPKICNRKLPSTGAGQEEGRLRAYR